MNTNIQTTEQLNDLPDFFSAAQLSEVLGLSKATTYRRVGEGKIIPRKNGTLVIAEISGLPATDTGFFAFHIHEGGNCSGSGFPNTGSHYDPDNRDHPLHMGDLPPLLSNGGTAYLTVMTGRFCIKDIIGRTVVIHSGPDDFRTQPAGNAGSKIACGVIRRV